MNLLLGLQSEFVSVTLAIELVELGVPNKSTCRLDIILDFT